ncbi:MAG: PINc/VapC family ATPase [Candidatus Woesearchaeota archaeon]
MQKPLERIVPDTSILIEGILSKKIAQGEIFAAHILIHEASLSELEAQANTHREIGYLGLEEIKKLHALAKEKGFTIGFAGDKPTEHEVLSARKGGIDALIRNLAYDMKAILMTADKVQAMTAEAKGVQVLLIVIPQTTKPLIIEKFFDATTMSVHLKENCTPKAKKGVPGNWNYVEISEKKLSYEDMKTIAKEIVEETTIRADGFIENERKYSTIIQLAEFRIVITRPPLADGYEITIVRPIKRLSLDEYAMSDKLKERLDSYAEGVLIAGSPGHGKSTFAQALGEFYAKKCKVVKTVEAPRDLVLGDEVTQYAITHATYQEIHDILLLSRPDYTIFDEIRNTTDFKLFSDLRLSGVGMVGVVHATNPIDAIQRFIGRIELGVIPHVVDTVIFIKNGGIEKVFSLGMQVKVPSGMMEADLARPIVVVNDFETGKLEYEIYSYGEETVVVPVQEESISPAAQLAAKVVKEEFLKFSDYVRVDMVSNTKCVVYVPAAKKPLIIGKGGATIEQIEKKLGLSIDVREVNEKTPARQTTVQYQAKIDKKNITLILPVSHANMDSDIYVNNTYVVTVKSSKKSVIKINKDSNQGRTILHALNEHEKVEIRQ